MKLNHLIPQLGYIVFELLEIDLEKAQSSEYVPRSVTAINLAVMPESLSYQLRSRDAIIQTQDNVYVQRYSYSPEQVRFTGTFGDDYRYVNGQKLDGWGRLKQFENEVIKTKDSDGNKIYTVNYYDFLFQRFGHINIDSWSLNANARSHSTLINYTLTFTIVGDLVVSTGLPLLGANIISSIMANGESNIAFFERYKENNISLQNIVASTLSDAMKILHRKTNDFTGILSAKNIIQGVF